MQALNRENPPNQTCLALRGDKNIAILRRSVIKNFLENVGRKCENCGAVSAIPKWTFTDAGLKCPACGHIQGGKAS